MSVNEYTSAVRINIAWTAETYSSEDKMNLDPLPLLLLIIIVIIIIIIIIVIKMKWKPF
jgi:hypothetical protein